IAVLGIVSVVFATYAEALAGPAALQSPRVQNTCGVDSKGHANATSERLVKHDASFLRAKSRPQVAKIIADVSTSRNDQTLCYAGLAQALMAPAERTTDRRADSARAPPLS